MTLDNKDDEFEILDSEEFDDEEELKNELVDEDDTIDGPVFEPSFDVDEEEIPFEENPVSDSEELSDISDDNDIKNETSNEIPSRKKDDMVSSEMSNNEKDSKDKKDTSNDNKIGESNNKDESSGNEKKDDNIIPDKKEEKKDPGEKTLDKNKDNKDKDNLNKKDSKNGDKNSNVKNLPKDKAPNAGKAAGAAKDKAKDAATNKAKDAAGGLSKKAPKGASKISDKKDIADNTKNAFKKGPKGLVGSSGVRAALAASENTNAYSKAAATAVKVMDNIIGKDRVDWILDKFGERTLRHTMVALVLGIIHAFMPFLLLLIGVYLFFAPLLDTLMAIDKGLRSLANTAEKFKNLVLNGNYADSKTAFYDEFERLAKIYGSDLDQPLLLSTTFYSDMKDGYQTRYDNIGDIFSDELTDENKDGMLGAFISIIQKEIESLVDESNETYDEETGLLYTVGKVYRLRQLADHMFAGEYKTTPMSLGEWREKMDIRMNAVLEETVYKMAARLGYSALAVVAGVALIAAGVALIAIPGIVSTLIGAFVTVIGLGLAVIGGASTIRALADINEDLKLLEKVAYMGQMSYKSIRIELQDLNGDGKIDKKDSTIYENAWKTGETEFHEGEEGYEEYKEKVDKLREIVEKCVIIDYYEPKYNETEYKKYLAEVYIPNNPDFEKFLSYDSFGKPTSSSIDRVINEIYEYSDYFKQLFYPDEVDIAEKYSEQCLGAIDKKLAAALEMPVDINTTNCIDFSGDNGYGYKANGSLHNGIEINAKSTGNVEGDKVYSVLGNGKVVSSSADDTPMTCVGGCIEIEYSYLLDGHPYDFTIIYKGLSKESVTLKSGDEVTKRQQLGTIGTADESEDMGISSLYLEFRTVGGMAIDPTNMIVKCGVPGVVNYEGGKMVNVPQQFTQTKFHTVTCLAKDGWHYGCGTTGSNVTKGTAQEAVYLKWVEQGAKDRNGIDVLTVDGIQRYMVAVTKSVGNPGDLINAYIGDTVVPMIIMDEKDSNDCNVWKDSEGKAWGHATCNKGTLDVSKMNCNQSKEGKLVCDPAKDPINVIEMEVNPETYRSIKDNVRTSTWGVEWDTTKPVISFINNGSILVKKDGKYTYSDQFDLSGNGTGTIISDDDTNYISSNGLQLCYPVGSSSKVEQYVSKAMEYANDDKIGYNMDWDKRKFNPDVDCSSLVYYSLVNSGVINAVGDPFNTGGMGAVLIENGFDELDYDKSILQKGDIVVDPRSGADGHTVIYLGDGKEVAAHGCKPSTSHPNRSCEAGDQDGSEVSISTFDDSYHQYTKIYRVKYDPEDRILPDPGTAVPGGGSETTKYTYKGNTIDVITLKSIYSTSTRSGVSGYADMLKSNYIYQNEAKGQHIQWVDCCLGMAKTQSCGFAYGVEIKLSDIENHFNGNDCNGDPSIVNGNCKGKYTNKCFSSEEEMTKHVISRIKEGKITLLHVSGLSKSFKVAGLTKSEFYQKASQYKLGRHFVMAAGFVKDGNSSDSLSLLYIDSSSASYKRIGESRFILKTDDDVNGNHECRNIGKPYYVVDFD